MSERTRTEAEGVDPLLRARAGALLLGIAGVLGWLSLLFPGGVGTSAAVAGSTSGVACGVGALLWFAGWRLPPVAYQLLGGLATALASVSASYGGPEGWLNGFFYFWIGLFIAYFFTPLQIVVQLLAIAAGFGVVVAFQSWQDRALIWFLTVSTLVVTVCVVAFLRVRLERALAFERERVARLQELDRLRSDLLSTVSHELRTPVAAVFGAAETLRRRRLTARTRAELLGVIASESTRLARLAEDIVGSTAIERGTVGLDLEPLDPLLVAEEAAAAARSATADRAIVVRASGRALVLADSARLRQAVGNLLDNALKYSPRELPIELEVLADRAAVQIVVRDRGPGIPPDERERVFDKFHRLDPNMHNGVGGSGLGLYIVHGLVTAMNGRVWIEPTTESEGTTVTIELPRAPVTAAPPSPAQASTC